MEKINTVLDIKILDNPSFSSDTDSEIIRNMYFYTTDMQFDSEGLIYDETISSL